jgi:hypothetical protein
MRIIYLWIKKVNIPGGVRRVPVSSRSLTGEVLGVDFESALERDLMLKMSFHHQLDWFQSQPVHIDYEYPPGQARRYTPDLLVSFTPDDNSVTPKPLLCEVKYREDLQENWRELRHKFRAAKAYCKAKDWRFEVFHEGRIRTQELVNIQFLWKYRASGFDKKIADVSYEAFRVAPKPVAMMETVKSLFSSDEQRGAAVWAWWCLASRGVIECDLNVPLTGNTQFWLAD